MLGVCCPRYLPCNPNHAAGPPPCASPEIYIALVVAAPVALIFWLRGILHPPLLEQLPVDGGDQIPAIPEDVGAAVCSSITPPDGSGSSNDGGDEKEDDKASPCPAEHAPAFINATIDRSADVTGLLNKILNAFEGILLDIHSSNDESTIHPANGVLIQSMEIFCDTTDRLQSIFGTEEYTVEPYSVMFARWVCKLEEDAELICQGEKGRKYIFLLNNTYDVWQMMRCPRAPFSNLELRSRFMPMIQRYKNSYFDECWLPLNNRCRLDKFTLVFHTIYKRQMAWKVTAELRYTLRQEIVNLILPAYELSLLANQRPLSEILYSLKRVMAGKKNKRSLLLRHWKRP